MRALAAILLLSVVFTGKVVAVETLLTGAEIKAVLSDVTVAGVKDGKPWRQSFRATGHTTYYEASRPPSDGQWRVQESKYCSKWPPFGGWACYEMTGDLDAEPRSVTFISSGGGRWPAIVESDQ